MWAPWDAASRIRDTALFRLVAVSVEQDIWTRATVNAEGEGFISVAPQADPLGSEHHLTKFFFGARWKSRGGKELHEHECANDLGKTAATLSGATRRKRGFKDPQEGSLH